MEGSKHPQKNIRLKRGITDDVEIFDAINPETSYTTPIETRQVASKRRHTVILFIKRPSVKTDTMYG